MEINNGTPQDPHRTQLTPVQEIRRAAALMREDAERAQAAAPGPWYPDDYRIRYQGEFPNDVCELGGAGRAVFPHIASWHPAVVLAVADWLDHEADRIQLGGPDIGVVIAPGEVRRSLAVARAYR
jgi:hypothetical protein